MTPPPLGPIETPLSLGVEQRIEVEPGVHVRVRDVGAGRPVVMLAGIGMNHRVLADSMAALARDHRVIGVDLRGTGGSDKPREGYGIERLSLDVEAVLRALDLSDVCLLGWSFGGQVAFKVALQCRQRVSRLILVASNAVAAARTPGYPFGAPADRMLPGLVAAEGHDVPAARREAIRVGFAQAPGPAMLDQLVAESLKMPPWAAVASYRTYLTTDLSAELPAFDLPTLQLIGADDPVQSSRGAAWLHGQLAARRSYAGLVVLPGVGHYPMLEAPAEFVAALTRFLAETS